MHSLSVRSFIKKAPFYMVLVFVTLLNIGIAVYGGKNPIINASVLTLFIIAGVLLLRSRMRLEQKANYDALTKLPNRAKFYEVLTNTVRVLAPEETVHVLLMDLNRFKHINDTLGHPTGDQLLQQAAERLRNSFRKSDFIARLGGDEFAVIVSGPNDVATLEPIFKRTVLAFDGPFQLNDHAVDVGISIGIASYPKDGDTIDDVVKRADVAMYSAKNQRTGYSIYTSDKDLDLLNVVTLPVDLKKAIPNCELEVYYQPKKCLSTNKIIGVEALVRWNHPKYGLMSPAKFLPIAEQIGIMNDLTAFVTKESIHQVKRWSEMGLNIVVSINTSADDLCDSTKITQIASLLAETGVSPKNIILEVTETAIMSNPDETLKLLIVLNTMGVTISIDDFGTGHASLTYLKNLPIKELKIEHAFVKDMARNKQDYNIVSSTIILGQMAGCQVVAEGVEDAHTEELLRSLGCEIVQGFYISPPKPVHEITDFILQYNEHK